MVPPCPDVCPFPSGSWESGPTREFANELVLAPPDRWMAPAVALPSVSGKFLASGLGVFALHRLG